MVQHQHSSACRILCTCASARVFGIHAKSTYTLRACKRECVNVSACMPQPLGRTNQAHVDPSHRSTRASTVARVCVCVIEETSHSLGDLFLELIVAGLFQFCFFGRKSITFFLQLIYFLLELRTLITAFLRSQLVSPFKCRDSRVSKFNDHFITGTLLFKCLHSTLHSLDSIVFARLF